MKKISIVLLTIMVLTVTLSLFACTTNSSVVGTYKLVTVYMDNGTNQQTYSADGTNAAVTANSFTLELKNNYKWNMNIMLPGLAEHEDGTWTEDNNVYALHEDRDDPVIELTFNGDMVSFIMSENDYVLNVTLVKQK